MAKPPIQVLLVEDNPIDVVLLREALRQDALDIFNLHTVEFLSDALEALQNKTFDIVLIDLGLPDAQGLETFNRIHQQVPALPKIILSGLADESLALQAVHAGAQDYMVKGTVGTAAAARAIRYAIERQNLSRTLIESEKRFSIAFHNSPSCQIITTLPEGRILDVNEAYCHMLGYELEEVIGRTTAELNLWANDEEQQSAFEVFRLEGRIKNREVTFRTRSGAHLTVLSSVESIEFKGMQCIISTALDITERKLAQHELQESRDRFSKFFHSSPVPMVIGDLNTGQVIDVNESYEQLVEYDKHEILGHTPFELSIYTDKEQVARAFQIARQSGGMNGVELKLQTKSGKAKDILAWSKVIQLNDGTTINLGTALDVTERKQAERALKASEANYRSFVENSDSAIAVLDGDGRILYANPYGIKVWDDPQVVGKTIFDLYPTKYAIRYSAAIKQVIDTQTSLLDEVESLINGKSMWFRLSMSPLKNPDGTVTSLVLNAWDLTARKQAEAALRESEEKYRGLMESLDSIVATVDREGRFLYMNDVAATQLGGMPRDFIGKTIHELLPEPAASSQLVEIQKVIRENKGIVTENLTMVQGEPRWYHTMIQPIHDENGHAIQALINSTDIHDLKTIQHELQELNRTLEERVEQRTAEIQDLYDNAPTGYHSLDADGRFNQINQTELFWLGYTREEVIGHPLDEFITEQSRLIFRGNFPHFKELGWLRDMELEFIRKDGSLLPALINAVAVYGETGNYVTSRSTVFDNTARAEAEKALRESQANLQNFLDTASDLIQSLNTEGDYVYVNNAWCETLGYSHAEALLLSIFDIVEPGYHDYCRAVLKELIRSGHAQQLETMFRTKHGEKILVEGSVSGLVNKDGISITNGIFRNITRRKQAEEVLRLANIEMERALRMKDEFLASMSHELRTPLTGILGLSEALQYDTYGEMNAKQKKAITTIESSGHHLLELINDILDISKIEAGRLELNMEICSLDEICQASLQLVKGMAHKKRQNVMFSMNPASITLRADGRRLKQILVNLLSNAVKYSPENNSIGLEINADEPNQTVNITVWDNGIGIAEEDLKKLFHPFLQLDSSLSRQQSGTGLGLALVQRLVDLHGGSIHVESSPNQGSRFTVMLSYLPSDTTQPHRWGEISLLPQLTLIVEDNDLDAERLIRHLKMLGIESAVHKNGSGVVEQAIKLQPNIILLDLQLPDVSGWDVLEQLKANEATRNIPIIITSVEEDRERASQLGVAGYLVKLFTLPDLQIALARAQEINAVSQHSSAALVSSQLALATVLIVDDNETNIFMVEDFLRSKNFNVLSAHSGLEFLSRVAEVQPDVVLMDIQMPDMDGLETMRRLRILPNPKLAAVPVIAITALAMPGDRERCIAAGANEYLSKPVRLMEISNLIQKMIQKR